MKKIFFAFALILFLSFFAFAQNVTWPRFEFNVMGGYGLAQFKGDFVYSDNISFQYLQYMKPNTTLSMKADNNAFFTGGFSFFFHPNVGIQLGGGYFSSKVPVTGSFAFTYKWTTSSTIFDESASWGGDGKMSTIPLFLNLVGKFRTNIVDIFVTAGPTLYLNSFEANSFVGLGDSLYFTVYIYPYWYYFQYVDAFQIPASIPKTSWTAFGANFGLGFDFKVAPGVAITVEGRYFLVPKKSLSWEWTPGTYDSIFYDHFSGWEYTADDFAPYQAKMTTADVNPSFISVALGIKVTFGQK
jgi:opacity protein-like surface antigen